MPNYFSVPISFSLWKGIHILHFFWRYHLNDVIIGKIYFLLVRIKIKNMELEIRRRESTGSGANTYVETETLAKFELMDGAPVRGMICCCACFVVVKQSIHVHSLISWLHSVTCSFNTSKV